VATDPFARAPETAAKPAPSGTGNKLRAALDYGLITLPGDIGKALLIGVVIAGILAAVIPEDYLATYLGRGPLSIALMMVVGIPLYVCATASVPLAASFIFLGASPGAALAFLVAGPATNAATVTTIARVLGRRTAGIFLGTVAVSAFGGGWLMDQLMPWAAQAVPALTGQMHHHEGVGWFDHLSAAILVLVMTWSWWQARQRGSCCDDGANSEGTCPVKDGADSLEFSVEGMNCSHCSGSVERTLSEMPGVTAVQVILTEGRATVTGEGLDDRAIISAIDGLGFKGARL
jgi:hypothetical protein